ncbi:hypothetical protein M569_04636, partial [Genlisea aurea]
FNDDVLGLIVFKSAVVDARNRLASWNEDDESPCAWRFVECDPGSGRVTAVSLDGVGLSGKIGRGLEKLQYLRTLSLSGNNFSGSVSPELLLLPNLQKLNLSGNGLAGSLPPSVVSKLQFLDLSGNALSGPLPDTTFVNNCSSLRHLSLAGNRLQGQIPWSLRQCASLNHLDLSSNLFSGYPDFSGGIWTLARLRTVDLSGNLLSGSIPGGISVVRSLKQLSLHGNQFSGPLPEDIGFCPHLTHLDLSKNQFTGTIPESLQNLTTTLQHLDLSNNFLTGDFPHWIHHISALQRIDVSNNRLTGSLPPSISAMMNSPLTFFSSSNNRLTGPIPSSFSDSASLLSVLRLSQNSFNGSIPADLFDTGLDELDLSRNELTGSIPPPSSKLFDTLGVLDLSGNNLTGKIPAEIGLLSKLRYLNLSGNQFESSIPPELGYFPNLTVLDLHAGGFTGSIPGDICDSGSLNILQLDGNSLTGAIPDEIGNCSSLHQLGLSNNNLSGTIPESLSRLSKLEVLELEMNQLSGEIPQRLADLENLRIANVSHNQLIGRLPPGGIFQSLDASAIEGNLGICSPLIEGPCKLNVPKPLVLDPYSYGSEMGSRNNHFRHSSASHSFFSASAIVAIAAAAFIAVGIIVVTLLNASVRRQLSFVDNTLESMCSSSANLTPGKLTFFDSKSSLDFLNTTLESVLNKSTEIGGGVFGTVYKASIGRQGRLLAIKKLVASTQTLVFQEEFDREIRGLAKAKHPNLNPLRGYYWTSGLQLLVSEYAVGGNLETKLHDPSSSSHELSWQNRLNIVNGIAKGIAHLHHDFQPPIIHYNIKPTNILLDEKLNPKISDFGLARLLGKFDSKLLDRSNRSQAESGYAAPELTCRSLRVNEKCDVYGFGVLILELVTGKKPVEHGEGNVVILSDRVRELLEQGNISRCVDKRMGPYPEEEVLPVIKLALVCTSQIPSSRPSMAEVVQILQVIKAPLPNRMTAF